ncbi:ATP-grasp domain-containing protein [Streptomyces sp. NPDC052225]|uniref:ATP-grasp domain-containing protein n=1 Tax=Streptomyces sp. NPDC052225 TaxID=3154949 RepID=UPI00342E7CC1
MTAALLTCCDPLRMRRPEPHFAAAVEAAGALGSGVALLDHDALLRGDTAGAVAGVPGGLGRLWYRGWMLPSASYARLADVLAERGSVLVTDGRRYRRAHELPGWYETFATMTPRSVWLPAEPKSMLPAARLAGLAASLGPGPVVVKDYVKSRKHEWDDACYVPDGADTERLAAVVRRFMELQEDFLAGGIVLRAFEDFTGDEVRVWWIDGEPSLVTVHPDVQEGTDVAEASLPGQELARVAPLVRALACRFVTTDLALRSDGVWRVVEVGDGQVSDLPAAVNQGCLVEPLLNALSS